MTDHDAARPVRRALLVGSLSLIVVGTGGVAAAAEGEGAAARALFAEARRLAAGGDYAAACPKFEESLRLDAGVGTSFNLADCVEHLGKTASAWARFLDVAAVTKAAGQLDRERVARARAAALEPRLSRLVITVQAADAGLTIQRDGLAVSTAGWGVAVPVNPGVHLVEAQAPRKKRWSVSVTVPADAATVVVAIPALDKNDVEATPLGAPGPAALASGAPSGARSGARSVASGGALPQVAVAHPLAAPARPARRWTRTTIALASVGVTGLVVGAIFGVKFLSANHDAKSICPTSVGCTLTENTRHDALVEEARSDLTREIVGAGVGAAALLAAAYLWTRPVPASSSARAAGPRFSLQPSARARTAGVDLALVW